jgi:HSP20 family protein
MPMYMPDPFGSLFDFQAALDALRASDWLAGGPSGAGAYPPINVFRKGEDYVLIAELPGVARSDLEIQVKDNSVRLAGVKKISYPEKAGVHRHERLSGHFDRVLTLPIEIDAERTKAEYRDGMLALFLPQAETDKPKRVEIR